MALSDLTPRRITRLIIGIVIISFVIYLSYLFSNVIIMLTISILISFIFNPLVEIFEKNKISRLNSILIVFVLSAVIIFLGLSIFIPKIANQMNTIATGLNQEKVSKFFNSIQEGIKEYIPFINPTNLGDQLSEFFSSLFFDSIDNISNIVSSIVSVVAISIIVPFMTFFILKDNRTIVKGIINLMPNKYFEVSYWIIKKITEQLGRFVRGWILDAFVVGFMAALGLAILGIDNSISIGVVAGVGHLIPYFGPIIGGLPAILISLIQFGDLTMLPAIGIMFIIIYTVDNGYIQPNVFSKSTDIHPLMIIILILIGSQIMGIFGMLLAVPTATVIKTATREIYYGYKNYKIIKV